LTTAAERWAEALGAHAIPQEILDAAPESPWGFPTALFTPDVDRERRRTTVSRRKALDALPEGGVVLDVGAGGGAASLPLAPPAGRIVAIDPSSELLDAFVAAAGGAGIDHRVIRGTWPEVAGDAPLGDVVVCHHVLYNVPDLVPFAAALTAHARNRVVVEMTERHPMTRLNALFEHFHGLPRPEGPTVSDAVDVLREAGFPVTWEPWVERREAHQHHSPAERVAFIRRRLCLPSERDAEIAALLGPDVEPHERTNVTLWWPGEGESA
jgi:precorrin-6B methylase 2